MPTYDYECPEGHRFEVFQKMTDDSVTECPECGAQAVRKISGGAGFLFKGEGFYITDYRSDDYKKRASAESGETPAKAATSEAKGDAKKSEAKKVGGEKSTGASESKSSGSSDS